MLSRRVSIRALALLVMGSISIIGGAAGVGSYAFEVWPQAGAADQSMAFWMLPFLLGGLLLICCGVALLVFWRLLMNSDRGN